jgi:hypothetical protein
MSRIAICIPSRGGQMEVATGFDVCSMTAYTLKNTKHDLNFYTAMGTLIFDQRNSIVETAIKDRCDYVMFIDGDMRFPKDALVRLLKHNKDIVGVNATTRSEPVKPTAKNFKIEEDGKVNWYPIYSKGKKGIEIADGIGCGVVLVKIDVFKKMEMPYYFFETLQKKAVLGEDIYFCIKAKDAGFDTWVDHDLSMEIGHVGSYIYGWQNIEMK